MRGFANEFRSLLIHPDAEMPEDAAEVEVDEFINDYFYTGDPMTEDYSSCEVVTQ